MIMIGSILAGLLAAFLVHKNIWVCVGIAGIGGGYSLGALTFAIAAKASRNEIQSLTAFYIWCGIFAFLGGLICCKWAKQIVIYGTSLLGAYVFMHGWYLVMSGLPEEGELVPRLISHEKIKMKGAFALYLVVFIVLFSISAFIQSKAEDHKDVTDTLDGKKKDPSHVELADDNA